MPVAFFRIFSWVVVVTSLLLFLPILFLRTLLAPFIAFHQAVQRKRIEMGAEKAWKLGYVDEATYRSVLWKLRQR